MRNKEKLMFSPHCEYVCNEDADEKTIKSLRYCSTNIMLIKRGRREVEQKEA